MLAHHVLSNLILDPGGIFNFLQVVKDFSNRVLLEFDCTNTNAEFKRFKNLYTFTLLTINNSPNVVILDVR